MKLALKKGSQNVSVNIFIQDSSKPTGEGLTGLAYNTTGLKCYYVRPRSNPVQLTLVTQTVTGVFSAGGFKEIDATNMPGVYRLDLHNNILASGVDSAQVMLHGAENMAPCPLEIQLTDFDLNSAGVSLVDGAITTDKIADNAISRYKVAINTYEDTAFYVQKRMGDKFEVFITGKYPDIVVSDAGSAGVNGVYEYKGISNGKPVYGKVGGAELDLIRWDNNNSRWKIDYDDDGYYYSTDDVPTPDLVTTWQVEYGSAPVPTVTANDTSLYAQLEAIRGAGWTSESLKAIADAIDSIDSGLDAAGVRTAIGLASANLDTQLSGIKTDTNNVTTRLTATRAGYIDKLNVAGNLANTTNAGDFKADTTGLAKTTDLSGLALEATLTAMKGAGWTNETLVAILEAIDEIDPGGGGGGATPQQIWEYANRELSTPSNYKADLTTLESRLTANRAGYLDKLNVPGTLANTNNAGTFKADVSGIPAAVWGFATRTLSGFGTLVSDIWNFATRTLSAFGFTVATSSDANVTAIKAKTDNLPASPAPAGEYDTQLDAKVSSRLASASYVAPDNASIGDIKAKTDQLTFTTPNVVDSSAVVDVGGLAEDIAEALEPIMPTPENIWTHAKRTLTMTPAEILSYIQQTAITQTRGNSWNIEIEDVSLPAAKQQIAIKCRTSQRDSESLLFIDTDGMVIINGEEYTDGGASLTYQGTTLTLKLDAKITALFHPDTYVYGIQGIDNNGVTEPYGGIFTIIADVVRAAE